MDWSDKVIKSGVSKFFKGCLPPNLLSPLLNTVSHTKVNYLKRSPVTIARQINYMFKQLWVNLF